jgi:hypothetical protein
MKKVLSLFAIIAAVTLFTACGDDDATYQAVPKLEIASVDVLFESDGGAGNIVVNTNQTLTATTDANWLTLSVIGNTVNLNASPNITLNGRSALIKLKAGDTETEVTATQKSSIYGLVDGLEYEMGDYQAKLNIDVVHSSTVTVQSGSDWLTATFNNETSQIELVAQDNDGADAREGYVTVNMNGIQDKVLITQSGMLLELEKDTVATKNNDPETLKVGLKHSRPITVESEDEWIKASFDTKNNQVVCEVTSPNETGWRRFGKVKIQSGAVSKMLTVSQFDFVNDIQGAYYMAYYSSGWKTMGVILETTSETEGTLTFASGSLAKLGVVLPITLNAENQTFTVANAYDTGSIYTKDDVDYMLTNFVMMLSPEDNKIYRVKASSLPYATAELEEDEDGIFFNFSAVYKSYEFYAFRIAYGTGGYEGYAGSYITLPYCYLMKIQ